MNKSEISKLMSEYGRRGGSVKGKSKVRGDSEYYRSIRAKRKTYDKKSKILSAIDNTNG